MKPNKQTYIDFILIELEKGIGYKVCLDVVGRKWTLSESSFKRYWKTANEQYIIKQESINKKLLITNIENKKEVLKTANLTKIDRILIAEKIAIGTARKFEGTIIVPSPSDQLKALDFLTKIYGEYAPAKTKTEVEFVNPTKITFTNDINDVD